jgi:predicted glutamine amidotransferase
MRPKDPWSEQVTDPGGGTPRTCWWIAAVLAVVVAGLCVVPGFAPPTEPGRNAPRPAPLATPGSWALRPDTTAHACRFWAMVGQSYPEGLLAEQLRDGSTSLRSLAPWNRDGWGFASFLSGPNTGLLRLPLIRRGRPRADDGAEEEYPLTVDELSSLRPRACLAHVRHASVAHIGIPDPHPFQHERWLFAHNGNLSTAILDSLVRLADPGYLDSHPPEYVDPYIDSELYFLYLLQCVHNSPGYFEEALCLAVRTVDAATGGWRRLNFVMTSGDTLWALRSALGDENDPVVCFPQSGGGASPYWIVASQALGNSTEGWAAIPQRSLGVFVPGMEPQFYSVDLTPPPAGTPAGPPPAATGFPFPNPSSGSVRIPLSDLRQREAWGGDVKGEVYCEIFDAGGRLVRRLSAPEGKDELEWDGRAETGRPAPPAVYLVRLTMGGTLLERKIVLAR